MKKYHLTFKLLLFFLITALPFAKSKISNMESLNPILNYPKNVLGKPLKTCCTSPMTGFYRTGSCETGSSDRGSHVVCAVVDQKFLDYTKTQGNDLCTPLPAFNFPGLKAGDKWCLCASRWLEAANAGYAPPVDLEATHEAALKTITLENLKKYDIRNQN